MDCVSSYSKISFNTLPQFSSFNLRSLQSNTLFKSKKKKSLPLVANCSSNNKNNNNGGENCVFNGLTAPLTPTTEAGRSLSGYMQNDKALFYAFVEKELDRLDYMRNDALLRSVFSLGTDEAILHRYNLEESFDKTPFILTRSWPLKQGPVPFGRLSDTKLTSVDPVSLIEGVKKHDNFRSYVMSFDHEIKLMCAKPKFKEAKSLIEKHCSALFGDESDEIVSTSFASLKRFVLEAVAFGSFLWDVEDYVRRFYRLEEN